MRVCHISKFFYPEMGGLEQVVKDIVDGTREYGVDSSIISFTKDKDLVNFDGMYKGYNINRFYSSSTISSQPLSISYFKAIENIDADIIHLHAPNPLASLALRSLKIDTPIIITHHADIIGKKVLKLLAAPLNNYAYSRARKIVATTKNYFDNSKELSSYKDKVDVIPIGTNIDNSLMPTSLNYMKSSNIVLAIGRAVSYKGFSYLIKAMNHVENAELIIIGDGPELESLKRISGGNVTFLGHVSDKEKKIWLNKSSLLCLPSINRAEAFGVVLLEAMANGLPVVTTEIGSGNSYVCQHNVTGLVVDPCDSKSLADAINTILSDQELHQRFSSAAIDRYKKHFTRDRMCDEYFKLYKSLT